MITWVGVRSVPGVRLTPPYATYSKDNNTHIASVDEYSNRHASDSTDGIIQ